MGVGNRSKDPASRRRDYFVVRSMDSRNSTAANKAACVAIEAKDDADLTRQYASQATDYPLTADVDHAARRFEEGGFADVVAGFLMLNCALDECGHLPIAGATLHHSVQVMVGL